jgi:hypothetical protein
VVFWPSGFLEAWGWPALCYPTVELTVGACTKLPVWLLPLLETASGREPRRQHKNKKRGLGYQGQKTTHVQDNTCFLALPPRAPRPKNHNVLEHVWFFAPGTPGLQTTRPKNHFGIALNFTSTGTCDSKIHKGPSTFPWKSKVGNRKMVLCRVVPEDKKSHVGHLGRLLAPGSPSGKVGAKPPTFPDGSPGARRPVWYQE